MNFKEKIQKEYTIGTWAEIPTPYASNIMAKAGFDFQIIDMEHGVFDFELIQNMIFSIKAENKSAFVRVPAISEDYILRALDCGADGIVFPGVTDENDVEKIVEYTKYAPVGNKGFNPYVYTGGYHGVDKDFFKIRNNELTICTIIESEEALNHLEQIVSNNNIDVIYIGQYDLSVSMGVPGEVNNQKVLDALDKAVVITKKYGKHIGCMVHSPSETKQMVKKGYDFIVYKVDAGILYQAVKSFISESKDDIL